MIKMKHHKNQATGSIQFIGWDEDRKVYSEDYYANVGIVNAGDSEHTTLKEVNELRKNFESDPEYANVQYLKTAGKRWRASIWNDRHDSSNEGEVYGEDIDALSYDDAEEIFTVHLTNKGLEGYLDEYPLLIEEIK